MADDKSGLIFDSLIWRGDNMVEVSYTEERDRGDGVALVRTLVIDRRKLPEYDSALIEVLVDFVEQGTSILIHDETRHG